MAKPMHPQTILNAKIAKPSFSSLSITWPFRFHHIQGT